MVYSFCICDKDPFLSFSVISINHIPFACGRIAATCPSHKRVGSLKPKITIIRTTVYTDWWMSFFYKIGPAHFLFKGCWVVFFIFNSDFYRKVCKKTVEPWSDDTTLLFEWHRLTHLSLAPFCGALANSADLDQTPQNDQGLHFLLTECTFISDFTAAQKYRWKTLTVDVICWSCRLLQSII